MASYVGTSSADVVVASQQADTINTGKGDDRVFARGGDDFVNAGAGDDYVEGGTGNDTIYGGDGRDTIFGGEGNDQLYGGGGGIDFLSGGSGADVFIVLAGDADPSDGITFYNMTPVDQWVRIYDLDFSEGDSVRLQDGDASDGFLNGFLEVAASGVTNQSVDSLGEFQQLGNYLLGLGADRVVENTQQGSLSFLLTDAEGQTTAVEFYGYSLSDLV